MTAAAFGGISGLHYPLVMYNGYGQTSSGNLDAVGEKAVFIGRMYLEGGPGSKTISSAGGKIDWRTASGVTWATAGSTLRVGIADVDLVNGPPGRDDGTFDVYKDLVQGTDSLANATWVSTAMATGTKTIAHGDLVAIVFELTVRNGADAVTVNKTNNNNVAYMLPFVSTFLGGVWATSVGAPCAVVTFDDGTLGFLDYSLAQKTTTNTSFDVNSAADEVCCIFELPGPVTVDALWARAGEDVAGGDFELILYSDPLGTPTVIETITIDADTTQATGASDFIFCPLTVLRTLSKDTKYAVAVRPTTANNVNIQVITFDVEAFKKCWPGGIKTQKGTRADQTGAFTASTTEIALAGVRIRSIDDGAGGAGGLLVHPGMAGGMRG